MRYRYPKLSHTLSFRQSESNRVEVTDYMTDNKYFFSTSAARYIKRLDGKTHPYQIPCKYTKEQIDEMIRFMDEHGLLLDSDIRRTSFGTYQKTLWCPQKDTCLVSVARITNAVLLWLWLPILLLGVAIFVSCIKKLSLDGFLWGYPIGIISGMIFHEMGHAIAGVSYGARVYEMGIMTSYFVLPGAYVTMDLQGVQNNLHRVQINAAGIEANCVLAGMYLILCTAFPSVGGMLFLASVSNFALALLNLTFINGLDGCNIISELIDVKSIVDQSRIVAINKNARRQLMQRGCVGYALILLCYIFVALQLLLPLIMITNALEVIACFVLKRGYGQWESPLRFLLLCHITHRYGLLAYWLYPILRFCDLRLFVGAEKTCLCF